MTDIATTPDLDTLTREVRAMLGRGEVAQARPLLSAVCAIAPPSVELWELEARLLLGEGRTGEALAMLDRAMMSWPEAAPLRLARAGARAAGGDLSGAAADAAEAVVLDPDEPRARALLGVVLLELNHVPEALPCLRSALRARPADTDARLALSHALDLRGETDAARAVLADGFPLDAQAARLWTAAVLLEVRHGAFEAAIALARQARASGGADACVLGLLGHALSSLGQNDEASEAYADALTLAPEDPYVRHLVAASGRIADTGRAPPEYVRVVFDGYAQRFDVHLMRLGYRVPGLARAWLEATPGSSGRVRQPVLDLGCGTGLMAVALADALRGPLVGVDLSPRMLREATARGLYAELHEADLLAFLAAEPRRFGLAFAGDVLPYFGDLRSLFTAVASRLTPGARFVLSAEALPSADTAGWRLSNRGRYAHQEAHLRAAAEAAGLAVDVLRPEVIRFEGDAPVAGYFVVLGHPA
jgi:predicted TPR repeat methyltransferase